MIKEFYIILNRIEGTLGKMQGKQEEICRTLVKQDSRQGKIEDRVTNLPCEEHIKYTNDKIEKRLQTKLFVGTVILAASIIFSSFAYTYTVEQNLHAHENRLEVHHYKIGK